MDNLNTRTDFKKIRNLIAEQINFKPVTEENNNNALRQNTVESSPPLLPKQVGFPKRNSDGDITFKITGETLHKVMDILQSKNMQADHNLRKEPMYDYLACDQLYVSLKVRNANHSSSENSRGTSLESDAYINPRQYNSTIHCDTNTSQDYVNMQATTTDLTKITIIKDYSCNGAKDSHTVRIGSKIYYDSCQNPRIEKQYTSVIGDSEKLDVSKYQKAISELMQSEYDYVNRLYHIYHNYIMYFRNSSYKIISEMGPFFAIIEEIYTQQTKFYEKLVSCRNINEIAAHFVENEKMFSLYRNYILNFNTAIRTLTVEYRFKVVTRQKALDDKISLEEYLLSPVQRLNKYILLLEQLESHRMTQMNSSSKVRALLENFRKLLASSREDAKVVNSILHRPTTLVNYGGYIMKDLFHVRKLSVDVKLMVFLFQEVMIFTVPENTGHFIYKYSIPMTDLYIRIIMDNPISFEVKDFQASKDREEKIYVLETVDPRTKDIWVEVIESLLWEQLIVCKNKVCNKIVSDEKV